MRAVQIHYPAHQELAVVVRDYDRLLGSTEVGRCAPHIATEHRVAHCFRGASVFGRSGPASPVKFTTPARSVGGSARSGC